MTKMSNTGSQKRPIPFDQGISQELDQAVIATESKDPLRVALGKRWKRSIEKKIWGEP